MTEQVDVEQFDAPYDEESSADALAPETMPVLPPVRVSGQAVRDLNVKMREWTGWPKAVVKAAHGEDETGSAYAVTDEREQTVTFNADALVLNPNRVLNTITPFRLRQEAVLTGTLLHEAGHARFSHWRNLNGDTLHSADADGNRAVVADQTMQLAVLLEEPRVEGKMAAAEFETGAYGLAWTMGAAAAHLLPMTSVSENAAQAMMDVLRSWTLRAGRQVALNVRAGRPLRGWVGDFTALLAEAMETHLDTLDPAPPLGSQPTRQKVMGLLLEMIRSDDDNGDTSFMVDTARDIMALLFPNTEPEDQPGTGQACASVGVSGNDGSGDQPEGGDEGEGDGGGDSSDDPTHQPEGKGAALFAEEIAKAEEKAGHAASEEKTAEAEQPAPAQPDPLGSGSAAGTEQGKRAHEWRQPTKEEREVQRHAERFLRTLVNPSEGSQVTLSSTPSSVVDGAALSAWKASGGVHEPRFFKRTRRAVQPAPPVKIAVLVDISSSMGILQKPSALLSWALSTAAFDLRNFAGRGSQIESCLIHWGSGEPIVVGQVGEMLPGIREVRCNEGTSAMGAALKEVEHQMPGFFDKGSASNRLIVQFTDWELWDRDGAAERMVVRALNAGVNMLSVAPADGLDRMGRLRDYTAAAPFADGKSSIMAYNKMFPEAVWDNATTLLKG